MVHHPYARGVKRARFLVCALAAAVALAIGCDPPAAPGSRFRTPSASGHAPAPAPASASRRLRSNVQRGDYAGSQSCKACHADLHASFVASPMHNMTRLVGGAEIHAPFDGAELHFKDDTVRLEQESGVRFMRVHSKENGTHIFRVTKVIGGHHREDFAGIDVSGGNGGNPGEEVILPVSYLLYTKRLRYKGYSVMARERPWIATGVVWRQTCILCHNTGPYLTSLLGVLGGPRPPSYQGTVVDALLPDASRWKFEVTDVDGLERALSDEMRVLGAEAPSGSLRQQVDRTIVATRAGFGEKHLVEIGIGCESCHGGSKEHVQDARVAPSFEPRSPFFRIKTEGGTAPTRAEEINHACARCHQVLFSRYPFTWEGGKRHVRPGGSNINSGEARDMLLGGCAKELACPACHDPHARDGRARLEALEKPAGNAVCTSCHSPLRDATALRAHSHHAPDGAAGVCVACHMPRKNMALDGRLTRYHRIGSPTDPIRVTLDRPLECALCHADKSVEAVVNDMERLWRKSYDRQALRALYGDMSANVMVATLERGKPHEQAVALFTLGKTHARASAPLVARQLSHLYPLLREYARDALAEIRGVPCDVDLDAEVAQIDLRARRCLDGASLPTSTAPGPTAAPLDTDDGGED